MKDTFKHIEAQESENYRLSQVQNMVQVALKATWAHADIPNVYRLRAWCIEEFGWLHAPTTHEIDDYLHVWGGTVYTGGKYGKSHPRHASPSQVDIYLPMLSANNSAYPIPHSNFYSEFRFPEGEDQ